LLDNTVVQCGISIGSITINTVSVIGSVCTCGKKSVTGFTSVLAG